MIVTDIEHLAAYRNLSPNFAKAIDYLLTHEPASLPLGRTVVDGDQVFINCFEYETKAAEQAQFEFHRLYADLHLVISGEELDYVTPPESLAIRQPYDTAKDAGLGTAGTGSQVVLAPGLAAIYYPEDSHLVGAKLSGPVKVRKAVVKVRLG